MSHSAQLSQKPLLVLGQNNCCNWPIVSGSKMFKEANSSPFVAVNKIQLADQEHHFFIKEVELSASGTIKS